MKPNRVGTNLISDGKFQKTGERIKKTFLLGLARMPFFLIDGS